MNAATDSLNNLKKWLEWFFFIYILLQPLLDVVAYFGTSLSLLFRVLAMGIGLVYLLVYPNSKAKWGAVVYLFVLGIFIVINVVNNFFIKEPFYLAREFTYSVKIMYVLEMIFVYIALFYSVKSKINWEKILQKSIFINFTVISLVMVLATITNTQNLSYEGNTAKLGHSGWFYSPNDLSATVAICFGFLIIFLTNLKNKKAKWAILPLVLINMWTMLTIGTKVGMMSQIAILIIGIVIYLILSLMKRDGWTNFFMLTILMLISLAMIPASAVGYNLNITYSNLIEKPESIVETIPEENNVNNRNDYPIEYKVFSGRDDFLRAHIKMYKEAPLSQKLFGMGPSGNYKEVFKIIEMDFFDWFFGYGIVGFTLFIMPLIYLAYHVIRRIFQYKFQMVTPQFLIIGATVVLALGIAAIAGHILMNPASGIYFSLAVAYLYMLSMKDRETQKYVLT